MRALDKICAYCLSTGSHFRAKIIKFTHFQSKKVPLFFLREEKLGEHAHTKINSKTSAAML